MRVQRVFSLSIMTSGQQRGTKGPIYSPSSPFKRTNIRWAFYFFKKKILIFFLKLDSSNRKFKADALPRQPPIDLGISIQPKINASALLLI